MERNIVKWIRRESKEAEGESRTLHPKVQLSGKEICPRRRGVVTKRRKKRSYTTAWRSNAALRKITELKKTNQQKKK